MNGVNSHMYPHRCEPGIVIKKVNQSKGHAVCPYCGSYYGDLIFAEEYQVYWIQEDCETNFTKQFGNYQEAIEYAEDLSKKITELSIGTRQTLTSKIRHENMQPGEAQ